MRPSCDGAILKRNEKHHQRFTRWLDLNISIGRHLCTIAALMIPVSTGYAGEPGRTIDGGQVMKVAEETANAQLKAIGGKFSISWVSAVMDVGYADFSHASQNGSVYSEALNAVADEAKWTPPLTHKAVPTNADDLCIGQMFLDLYEAHPAAQRIDPLKSRLDLLVDRIKSEPDDGTHMAWWWCDALFMAPPVLARMSAVTGDSKYIDAMDTEYWRTFKALYDPNEHLFYRGGKFIGKPDAKGKKIFWARGNGWVVAGLARVLQFMPADYPARPKYVSLLTEMLTRLATLQTRDGTWHSSLLDPDLFNSPETSGTSLITYAMAWGINNKLLDREKYLPIVGRMVCPAMCNPWPLSPAPARPMAPSFTPQGPCSWMRSRFRSSSRATLLTFLERPNPLLPTCWQWTKEPMPPPRPVPVPGQVNRWCNPSLAPLLLHAMFQNAWTISHGRTTESLIASMGPLSSTRRTSTAAAASMCGSNRCEGS